MSSPLTELFERVLDPRLSVNSGVYSAIDPRIGLELSETGEYQYVGIDAEYDGPADLLLAVSAFGGVSPDEDTLGAALYGHQADVNHDPVVGYHLSAYAGWSLDDGLRASSSSGGIATAVLLELMRAGEIDAVIHMRPGGPYGALFSYQISRSEEEIRAGSKTRYYPGELGAALRGAMATPGKYAVVGIPSFIYEIRLLQRVDPYFREAIAFTVGLICGHQKSAAYASAMGWRAGIDPAHLASVDFRAKDLNRPASRYATDFTVRADDGDRALTASLWDAPEADWGLGYFKTNFSDFTEDVFNETADIVLGDAWLPKYVDDPRGTNVVLIRDARVGEVLLRARTAGAVHLEPIGIADLLQSQRALVRQNVEEIGMRFALLRSRGEYVPRLRRSAMGHLSFSRRLVQRARVDASRLSHDAFRQAILANDHAVFDRVMRPVLRRYRAAQRLDRIERKLKQGPRATLNAVWKRLR
ncbi:Coenzyme F420 hydrogenase/dehydrogenase, beta subunit C-terminal domain [Microbacterium sp. NPDC055903]